MRAQWSGLRSPVVVLAFGGWNDAGEAATNALHHLRDHYPTTFVADLESEDYFDYTATRPMVQLTPEGRWISWPRITLTIVELPDRDLVLIEGPEPALKWRSFTALLADEINGVRPEAVVLLGAMLSDAPHSRPLPRTGNAHSDELSDRLDFEPNNYEGPTGIVGVLADAFSHLGMPVVSLWTAVPHYVANPPSPKATLVLLNGLETVLGAPLELGDLPSDVTQWEHSVDELATTDPDIAEYIANLENMADSVKQAEGSGDEIAAAFERYLQGREED